ncbi:hypothetical protein EUX98_g7005 [Antrodiella citrinella]|uniref:RING-type domain-containing protein n=1 Tax=Antrodiella citrinella TaxID=2447956 RepID=A0A4S4MPL6_9APHY|nr:hypothetical protein EUX98_g7005 [Antrodiella citrinella]
MSVDVSCQVCLKTRELTFIRVLPRCGHGFCKPCIDKLSVKAHTSQTESTCPTCQQTFEQWEPIKVALDPPYGPIPMPHADFIETAGVDLGPLVSLFSEGSNLKAELMQILVRMHTGEESGTAGKKTTYEEFRKDYDDLVSRVKITLGKLEIATCHEHCVWTAWKRVFCGLLRLFLVCSWCNEQVAHDYLIKSEEMSLELLAKTQQGHETAIKEVQDNNKEVKREYHDLQYESELQLQKNLQTIATLRQTRDRLAWVIMAILFGTICFVLFVEPSVICRSRVCRY